MSNTFDIIGGFIVRLVGSDQLPTVLATLARLNFTVATVDGTQIHDKQSLFDAIHTAMGLADYSPRVPTNWDSFSDYLWQMVMDRGVTKQAVILEKAQSLLSDHPELLFQLAETLFHLETIVTDARQQDHAPALMIRLFVNWKP
jgi:hypothetical protein